MTAVVHVDHAMTWKSPPPQSRTMTLMFERDITPTVNMAVGMVRIPPAEEQSKLSVHEGVEEIYFVTAGRGEFVLGDQRFEMRKGTGVYVAPGTGHRAINTGPEILELFYVNTPSAFGPIGAYADLLADWERIR